MVEVILPGEPAHTQINNILKKNRSDFGKHKSTAIYNGIAEEYNRAPIGSFFNIGKMEEATISNVARVLIGRGLNRDTDFAISRVFRSASGVPVPVENRVIVLQKLTDRPMRVVL